MGGRNRPFRYEVEGAFRTNDFDLSEDLQSALGGDVEGDFHAISAMGNVYVDVPVTERVEIYVGGGIGVAFVTVDLTLNSGFGTFSDEVDDTVVAYQFLIGAAFRVRERVSITTGYRMWSTGNLEFDFTEFEAPVVHTAEIGLRFEF